MKKIIFCLGTLLMLGNFTTAVVAKTNSANAYAQIDSRKTKVSENKLPEAVKKTLEGNDYKDWKIEEVYLFKENVKKGKDGNKNAEEFYQVTLRKDYTTKTINIDTDGNVIS